MIISPVEFGVPHKAGIRTDRDSNHNAVLFAQAPLFLIFLSSEDNLLSMCDVANSRITA